MRLVIHDFKVNQEEDLKMSKYPTNMYRDDEVKASILNFIKNQRQELLNNFSRADIQVGASKILENEQDKINVKSDDKTLREKNAISLKERKEASVKILADDDLFTAFTFEALPKTQILSMQELYVLEKGLESFRKVNINISS